MRITFKLAVIAMITVLLATSLLVYGASAGKTKVDPQDPYGPPINSHLADSPWATNHGNPYRQDSSRYAGPTQPPTGEIEDFLLGRPGTTHVDFSSTYPDGSRVMWASTYGVVFKRQTQTARGWPTSTRLKASRDRGCLIRWLNKWQT
jgi:hypothetical protein